MYSSFSVVITTKDRLDFLKRCYLSIVKNSILPSEVIIVNDGGPVLSTDTLGFIDNEVELRIFNNINSKGANYCRNFGIEKSESEIIFFIDDDDAFSPNSFETRMEIFSLDKSVGLAYTGFEIVYSDDLNNVIPSRQKTHKIECYTESLLEKGNIIGSTSRVAVRKSAINKVGGFDENLGSFQDYDMWIRLSKVTNVVCDNSKGIIYTIHRGMSSQVSINYRRYLDSTKYLVEKYNDSSFSKSYLNSFYSNLYFRIAIAGADNLTVKFKYGLTSLKYEKRLDVFIFLIVPTRILRVFKSFV